MKKLNNNQNLLRTCIAVAGILALGVSASSCVEEITDTQYDPQVMLVNGQLTEVPFTSAFVVNAVPEEKGYGSVDNPLPFYAPKWRYYNIPQGSNKGTPADMEFGVTYQDEAGNTIQAEDGFKIKMSAYAVDIHGKFNKLYSGWATVKAVPGEIKVAKSYCTSICEKEKLSDNCDTYCEDKGSKLYFKDGQIGNWTFDDTGKPTNVTDGVEIQLRYSYGSTRIWIEDSEADPVTGVLHGYNVSNIVTGVSEEFVFDDQTIYAIQHNPDFPDGGTPLLKKFGDIKARPGHDLVVTNVVSTGFYITDIVDTDKTEDPYDFNSIFIFSYSQPSRVDIGDRICEATGGIAEFTGMTQMQFPSWGIQNKERSTAEDTDPAPEDGDEGAGSCVDNETGKTRPCTDEEKANMAEIVDCWATYEPERALECTDAEMDKKFGPASTENTARAAFAKKCHAEKQAFATIPLDKVKPLQIDWRVLQCGLDGNNRGDRVACEKLESMEGSIITIDDLDLSSYFIDCDDNGNAKIDSGTAEADCRTECNANHKCTEYSNISSYDQWKARANGTVDIDGVPTTIKSEISVASSSMVANFDITEGCISLYDVNLRKNTFCQPRKISKLTGTLKQVLPGCYASKVNKGTCFSSSENIVMSVIEPRFQSDLIFDEEYNNKAATAFKSCSEKCETDYGYTPNKTDPAIITGYIDCMKNC